MNPETEFREGLDELAGHYKEVLKLLGEAPEREGLLHRLQHQSVNQRLRLSQHQHQ